MKNPLKKWIWILGISVLLGGVSEFFNYWGFWDFDMWPWPNLLALFVVPAFFLAMTILFDVTERRNPPGKFLRTAGNLVFLFLTSLHLVILTLPEMRLFREGAFLWWTLLLLPLLVEIHLIPLFHFFSDRHPRVIRIIKYVLFLLLYGYGLFIFWGYGLAGLGV